MGCFDWVHSFLLKHKKIPSDEKILKHMQKKWGDTAAMNKLAELENFRPASGGCEITVDIGELKVASQPPTRTSVIAVRHLLNSNSQRDARIRRAELLHTKLAALEQANKKREDCLLRKEALDLEFRENAMAKRQQKDEAHFRAVSRLQMSRPASRIQATRSPGNADQEKSRPGSRCGSAGSGIANAAAGNDLKVGRC